MENQFTASLWGDEGFSAILSMKSIPDIIAIIARDTSPPLWNIFEHLLFKFIGNQEIHIRGLSFVFFLGSVFFTYKLGSFIFSRKTGVLASVLTFLNPFFFIYAFEGRMYSILAFGVSASMYFFLKILYDQEGASTLNKLGYVVSTLWALYSHHFAFFAVFVQLLWWLTEFLFGKRIRAKKLFKNFLLVGIFYIPWLYPLYLQTSQVSRGFWLAKPDLIDLRNLIYDFIATGIKNDNLKIPFTDLAFYQASLYLAFLILIMRKWWRKVKISLFFVIFFLTPIILTWFISQYFQSIFFNRYLLFTIPSFSIIVASCRNKISPFVIFFLILILAIIDYDYFIHPKKLPFKQVASYIKTQMREEDFLINWYSNGTHHLWETKYYSIPAPIFNPKKEKLPFFVGTALMQDEDFVSEIPDQVKRVAVITSGPIEEISIQGYTKTKVETFDSLKVVWFSKLAEYED